MDYPKPIKDLIDGYLALPGIGKKTAERLALFTFSEMDEETTKRLGEAIINVKSNLYHCPICHNIIRSVGDAVVSCHGITLPPLEAEDTDDAHRITIQKVEDEHFITVHHDMTKKHYISFVAYLTGDRVQFVKFYPEGNAETRLNFRGSGFLYLYCNKHGLMKQKV